jgi:hypothetical protein
MNTLDHLRLQRKKELASLRQRYLGHTISSQQSSISAEAFEKESYWLEKDSSFINRGLPLFSRKGRIYYRREKEVFYESAQEILEYLDALVDKRNPQQKISHSELAEDWILDLGCGKGIALEDLCAYYGPLLNLKLVGTTFHTPGYQQEFARRNIFLLESQPLALPSNLVPEQGYSLIMANQVIEYYPSTDLQEFVQFAQRQLTAEGLFSSSRREHDDFLVAKNNC